MAHRICGGGEQTVYSLPSLPSATAAKRTYSCTHDDAEPWPGPLDPEKRRRIAAATTAAGDPYVPDCDIPLRSIEPCDPAAPDRNCPVFYVLYEDGLDTTAGRLHWQDRLRETESRSPLPATAVPRGPKHWAKGAHLRTSDVMVASAASSPGLSHTHSSTPQWVRYEDWRERNSAYDMAADQEEQEEQEQEQEEVFVLPPPATAPVAATQPGFVSDDEAADNVAAHLASFVRRHPTSRQERILRSLIHPKSGTGTADFELDDDALDNILHTANDLFFGGRLKHRVRWDWSGTNADPRYDSKIIGHTSLRRRRPDDGGGIETFVRLSTPILKNRAYSRRLLISAFLHELIHCYLFICCGWAARKDGGHTDGFRRIADTIDHWAGRDNLFLCQVEADLEQFRQAPQLRLPLYYVLNTACRPVDSDWLGSCRWS